MNHDQSEFQLEKESPQKPSLSSEIGKASGEAGDHRFPNHRERDPSSYDLNDELLHSLYHLLAPLVRGWTYHAGIPAWKGQEHDVAEDLLQMALFKIIKYLNHASENGIPIHSLEHLSKIIAKHCFLDLRRHDMRLSRMPQDNTDPPLPELLVDPAAEAEATLYEQELLTASARIIATFPPKIRLALLTDLANHTDFVETPTLLQQAFLDVGISLQAYQQPLPTSKNVRSNQSALRSLAYKRLAQEISEQESGEIELDAPVIRENKELATLALHLQHTRHFMATSEFQQKLRARLLAQEFRPAFRGAPQQSLVRVPAHRAESERFYAHKPAQKAENQENSWHMDEPDTTEILNDPELTMLARLLRTSVAPVDIDPVFKEQLRAKLMNTLRQQAQQGGD